jgi:aminoglycoside phosphotransferase (APT) family kinase protein
MRGAVTAAREFEVMERLRGAGMPVPQPFWLETDAAPLGRPFVVMERIAGRPVDGVTAYEPDVARRRSLERRSCALLVRVHQLDWRTLLPPEAAAVEPDPRQMLREQLAQLRAETRALGGDDFEAVFEWLEARMPALREPLLALIHGDFHPGNVLLDSSDALWLIDWTGTRIMDPRYDLALSVVLTTTWGNAGARERWLSAYAELAGRPVEQIEWFEVLAAAMRLARLAAALRGDAGAAGLRAGSAAQIARTGSHVRRVHDLLERGIGRELPAANELLERLRALRSERDGTPPPSQSDCTASPARRSEERP